MLRSCVAPSEIQRYPNLGARVAHYATSARIDFARKKKNTATKEPHSRTAENIAGPGTFATADADTASKPIALSFVSSVSAIRIGFAAGEFPAREFPIQREIQKLEEELHAFNQRIAELEDEGHNGRAINVLKANALDFASRIDELRCILVEQTKKRKSS